MSPKEFYFIRHATTRYNIEKRYTGNHDIPIYPIQNIPLETETFLKKNYQHIPLLSSSMERAMQTIALLIENNNVNVKIVDGLKERDFGILNGRKKLRYQKKVFYKGESSYQFQKRVLKEFKTIARKYEKFVIVSHSGVYKILYKHLKRINPNLNPTIQNLELVKFNLC